MGSCGLEDSLYQAWFSPGLILYHNTPKFGQCVPQLSALTSLVGG